MKYIKTILAIVFMLVLLVGSINAIDFAKNDSIFINKEEQKLNLNNIKITNSYTSKLEQSSTATNNFLIFGLQITDLKLSPSEIVGGKTVAVSFDVFNNQLFPVYSTNVKVTVKGMTISNQKYLGTMQKYEKKSVKLGLTLPLCANGAETVELYDVVVEVSYTPEINGKMQYETKEKQLTVYNDLSCNQPVPPVEPKSDPIVTIKASNETPEVGDSISFSAEFTKGTPSDFVYSWDFNGDALADSSKAVDSYTYAKAGTYTVTLTLKDSKNNMKETKVTKQIVVSEKAIPQEEAPEFTILIITAAPKVNEQVLFNVAFTKGVPSDFVYSWDFNGDALADSSKVADSYTYTKAGTYTITLTISKAGKQYTAAKQISVADASGNPVNTAPTADFTFSPAIPLVNTAVQFTASSSDAENDVLTYAWDFNSDNVIDSTISNPNVTFASTRSYNVVLTVSDGKLSTVVKKTVAVTAVPVDPAVQTEQQKYNDLENKFEEYEDDYVDLKDDYESALESNDEDELDDVKDDLDDLYNDIKKLNNDIDDFQSIVKDEDIEDDLKELEKDVKDLKQKVLDLKNGKIDESILNPSSSTTEQPQQTTYVPQSQPTQQPKTTVEVFTTPNAPSTPAFTAQPKDNTVKIALIIAGLFILLALVVFIVAVIFTRF
ncbi:PKD domain-containing protein [Candidatus Woesearchaeota archaeon]|nr:PKD domain-containing protein [Candidatus Woesearchaeota archaeon]